MGLVKMIGSTIVTLGLIGGGLQVSGVYNVKDNVVSPVFETVKSEDYEALREMKVVRLSDTDYLWSNISREQKAEFAKRGVKALSLEERADLIRSEWQKIGPQAKYGIIKAELDEMLDKFYK